MADLEDGLVQLANSLLDQLHITTQLSSLDELNSGIFALIYEGLCGDRIPDLIQKPRTHQDEIHNCQLVIDALSMDVLHTSLSHITGEDLASGDSIALSNLLEIYSGLLEYILNKIESDISSTDGDNGPEGDDDPDAMASDIIDDILQRELGRPREPVGQTNGRTKKPPPGAQTRPAPGQKRTQFPEHLQSSQKCSTIRPKAAWEPVAGTDQPVRLTQAKVSLGRSPPEQGDQGRSLETTDSLIREGELLERQMRDHSPPVRVTVPHTVSDTAAAPDVTPELTLPKRSGTDQGTFDHIGLRNITQNLQETHREGTQMQPLAGGQHHTYTHHMYHHYSYPRSQSGLQRSRKDEADVLAGAAVTRATSLPTDTLFTESSRPSRDRVADLRSTVRPAHSRPTDRLQSAEGTSKTPAYDSLKATVEKTVQMTRDAVSPERRTVQENLSENIRERLSRIEVESSEISHLASSLNLPQRTRPLAGERPLSQSAQPSGNANELECPGRSQRKVSFHVEEEQDRKRAQNESCLPDSPVKSSLRRFYEERARRKQVSPDVAPRQTVEGREPQFLPRSVHGYGSDGDLDDLFDGLSSPEASPVRQPYRKRYGKLTTGDLAGGTGKKPVTQKKTDLNIKRKKAAVDAIRDTKNFVDKEDLRAKKKADYLRVLYEHELEDFRDELKEQRAKEKTKAESEYKKKISSAKPKVGSGRKAGVVTGKASSRVGRTKPKQRRRSASASPTMGRRIASSTIEPENNLFSMLYQEFPYLYLSPDTWHELWRQGIQQIERLTRAQQAVRTKKNRGIAQLEEAEDRQKILMNIMRKELSHSQRMREQKTKRQQELSIKNKLHEKRMQSAKARKYYSEYQVRSRAKMLKRRTKEEMIFKKLFRDGIDIQKERIKELRRYATEQREIQAKERQNDIDSLENYYRDQFEMLAESVTREREDQQLREKAQSRVLNQMKIELRKKMEKEIKEFQEQLFRDDDDIYFRQLDADRLKEELRVAKYHVKV